MKNSRRSTAAGVACLAVSTLFCGLSDTVSASASVDATSAYMVIPIVAQTSSYASEVTVFNPQLVSMTLDVSYLGGNGTASVGLRSCGTIFVPARQAIQFSVGTKCSLPAGSNFGLLAIAENSLAIPGNFHAYSRVANPQGIGFSVPAYPVAVFESLMSEVIGLKRQSGSPGYQTNCFVSSYNEPVQFQLALYSASNVQIGSTISGTLATAEFRRYLDVFAAVGAPAGNYTNVRAEFTSVGGSGAALIAFCTVQDNTSFGADFRIAGETNPADTTRKLLTEVPSNTFSFTSYGLMAVFNFSFRAPDNVRCWLSSNQLGALEMRLKDPYGVVVAGGSNVTDTGRFYIGPRSYYPYSGWWQLEVSVRESAIPVYPLYYGYSCASGSGHAEVGVYLDYDEF